MFVKKIFMKWKIVFVFVKYLLMGKGLMCFFLLKFSLCWICLLDLEVIYFI